MKKHYSKDIEEHREWLEGFGVQPLRKWETLLENDPQAAICEACTRRLLADQNVDVKPNDHGPDGGPDYLCAKNGKSFYVEVTCITKDAATRETGLSDPELACTDHYSLTRKILGEVSNKTRQCSNLGTPCLLAIGTLHGPASELCFRKDDAEDLLTGTSKITANIDTRDGQMVGEPYETTSLSDSVFVRRIKSSPNKIEYARFPISGVLLCPFGCKPSYSVGVLHPNPNYPFERKLLPDIPFGILRDGHQDGNFSVEWI